MIGIDILMLLELIIQPLMLFVCISCYEVNRAELGKVTLEAGVHELLP